MNRPSGDHAGSQSGAASVVSRRGGPLAPIILTYMSVLFCFSPPQAKATWLPSGEKLGLP